MKQLHQPKLVLPVNEAMKRDVLLFNNPILIQGLALTPAVAVTTTVKSAVIISLLFLLVGPVSRVIAEQLCRRTPPKMRAMAYALVCAVAYIPAYFVLNFLFGVDLMLLGVYLPMAVLDGLLVSRSEFVGRESAGVAFVNGLMTALGAALALLLTGTLRELLSAGTFYGVRIFQNGLIPAADTVAGGMMCVAVLAALFQSLAGLYKQHRYREEDERND